MTKAEPEDRATSSGSARSTEGQKKREARLATSSAGTEARRCPPRKPKSGTVSPTETEAERRHQTPERQEKQIRDLRLWNCEQSKKKISNMNFDAWEQHSS
ncbi:hypothetical protein KOW79_021336 [Hemibagrus wyckioides]|uniref:Uncharacterized protein n=1 Tax=Hemibagrus wyckioides TaxID=337641 RepID=A0A9D3N2P4_9TELE|nr:hypothetical protein KOW79_021336 [Hemibagrus wyckioides]